MLVKPEYVYKQMEQQQCPYYTIKEGSAVVGMQQEEGTEVSDAIELLKEDFSMFTGGTLQVTISNKCNLKKASGGRDFKNYTYSVKFSGESGSTSGNSGNFNQILDLHLKLKDMENNNKLAEVNRKLEEIEKGKGQNKAIEKLAMKLIDKITGEETPVKDNASIAGNTEEEKKQTEKEVSETTQRLQAALKKWKKADQKYIELIEAIAKIATDDPDTYQTYVPLLKKMA